MNKESNTVLDLLDIWLDQHEPFINGRGLKANLVRCQPTEKTARYIDFDSKSHIARATIWESGELDIEVLEVDSGHRVVAEHHAVNDLKPLTLILNRFLEKIS